MVSNLHASLLMQSLDKNLHKISHKDPAVYMPQHLQESHLQIAINGYLPSGNQNKEHNHETDTTVFTQLNATAFIKFLALSMLRLFKGSIYLKAAFISK